MSRRDKVPSINWQLQKRTTILWRRGTNKRLPFANSTHPTANYRPSQRVAISGRHYYENYYYYEHSSSQPSIQKRREDFFDDLLFLLPLQLIAELFIYWSFMFPWVGKYRNWDSWLVFNMTFSTPYCWLWSLRNNVLLSIYFKILKSEWGSFLNYVSGLIVAICRSKHKVFKARYIKAVAAQAAAINPIETMLLEAAALELPGSRLTFTLNSTSSSSCKSRDSVALLWRARVPVGANVTSPVHWSCVFPLSRYSLLTMLVVGSPPL